MLDLTKPVQTRGGLPARIVCTDIKGNYPIMALVLRDGAEFPTTHLPDGRWHVTYEHSDKDLINVPEKRVAYANVYKTYIGDTHETLDLAQVVARCAFDDGHLGTNKLTFEGAQLKDVCVVSKP